MSRRFPAPYSERFRYSETADRLRELARERRLEAIPHGFTTVPGDEVGPRIELSVPIVQRHLLSSDYEASLEALDDEIGILLVVLVQAGAAALGVIREGQLARHKVIKKYMVRGKGRYQGTHLKTKGKSRYGSRLRLQMAVEFFLEINQKLTDWDGEDGPFDRVYLSCPVRLANELYGAKVAPPFGRDEERVEKIPLTVRVPSFKELRRICFELTHGTVQTFDGAD